MKAGTMFRKRLFAFMLLVAFVMGTAMVPVTAGDESRDAFDWVSGITVSDVELDAKDIDNLDPLSYKAGTTNLVVGVENTGEVYLDDVRLNVEVYKKSGSAWDLNFTFDENMTTYLDLIGSGGISDYEWTCSLGTWASNGTDDVPWEPKNGVYNITVNVSATDIMLEPVWDVMEVIVTFGDSTDLGFDVLGTMEEPAYLGVNDEVMLFGLPHMDMGTATDYSDDKWCIKNASATPVAYLTVNVTSMGFTAPDPDLEVNVTYEVTDWHGTTLEGPHVLQGPWDKLFVFDSGMEWDDYNATLANQTYYIKVWVNNTVEEKSLTDYDDTNNVTIRTLNACVRDLMPVIDTMADGEALVDGEDYPMAAYEFNFTIQNIGELDCTEDHVIGNVGGTPGQSRFTTVITVDSEFGPTADPVNKTYALTPDIWGDGAGGNPDAAFSGEVTAVADVGAGDEWVADHEGWYWINITTGFMEIQDHGVALEEDDVDANNMTSYRIYIGELAAPAKVDGVSAVINTPVTGMYPYDYGLTVNATVTNTGNQKTDRYDKAGDESYVDVHMAVYEHAANHGLAMVYEDNVTLEDDNGGFLVMGPDDWEWVVFDVPDDEYEINTDYDIFVWVNVTNATESLFSYPDEHYWADYPDDTYNNVTFYKPPNGTISGEVTGAPAGYAVTASNGEIAYEAETDGDGLFAFEETFDYLDLWEVSFEGGYIYMDDVEVDVEVMSDDNTFVTLEAVAYPTAKVMGTVAVMNDDGNVNVTREVEIRDYMDMEGDSKATIEYNETLGYVWTMWVYKANIVSGVTEVNITAAVPDYAKYFDMVWDDEVVIYNYTDDEMNNTEDVMFELTYDPGVAVSFTETNDAGEVLVNPDSKARIVFTEMFNVDTINKSTVFYKGGARAYNATLGMDISDDNETIILDLDGIVEDNTYTVVVTTDVAIHDSDKAYLPWDLEFDFTTEAGGVFWDISGTVTDMAGVPIENASVTLAGGIQAYTNADGEYEMLEVANGTYEITASKVGFLPDSMELDVDMNKVDVDFELVFWPIAAGETTTPEPGDINISISDPIVVPFMAAMNTSTFDAINVTLTYDDGARATVQAPGAITWAAANATMTYTPEADLMQGTTYTFMVSSDVLWADGNTLGRDFVFDFTTAEKIEVPPVNLTAVISPANDAEDQATNVPVTVTFNTAMVANATQTAITASFNVTSWTWSDDAMTVTLGHDAFAECTEYTVTVGVDVAFVAAEGFNALAEPVVSTFETVCDIEPTTVEIEFGPFDDLEEGDTVTLEIGGESYEGVVDEDGYVTFEVPLTVFEGAAGDTYTLESGDWKWEGDVDDLEDEDGDGIIDTVTDPEDLEVLNEPEGTDNMMIYAIIGIVIIIIILLLAFASKGGKKEEEMPAEEEEAEKGEFECPSCGAMVSGDVGECPECGEVFEEDQFRCPECGAEVEPGMEECPECGETLEVPEKPEGEEEDLGEELPEEEAEADEDFEVETEEEPMEAMEDEEDLGEEEEDLGDDEDDDFEDEEEDDLDLDDDEDEVKED